MISPMTDWLSGDPRRELRSRSDTNGLVWVRITNETWTLSVSGSGGTIEEAMAEALNTLMAEQGEEK